MKRFVGLLVRLLAGDIAGLSGNMLDFLQERTDAGASQGKHAIPLRRGLLTFWLRGYMLTHPDAVKAVTDLDDTTNQQGWIQWLAFFPLAGIFQMFGKIHRLQRKAMAKALDKTTTMKIYFGSVLLAIEDLLQAIVPGKEADFDELADDFTGNVIARILIRDAKAHTIMRKVAQLSKVLVQAIVDGFSPNLVRNLKGQYRKWQVSRGLKAVVGEALDYAKTQPGSDKDLISLLLTAVKDNEMTMSQLNGHLATFFVAGHETTAQIIRWIVWLLSSRPDIRAKLEEEVYSIGKDYRELTHEDLRRMPYLDAFVKEVLRYYSSALIHMRRISEDIVLADGTILRKGSLVMMPIRAINVSPHLAVNKFPLDQFIVERWFAAEKPPFETFGDGPKYCIGADMAKLEAALFTYAVIQNYEKVEVVNPRDMFMVGITTGGPKRAPIGIFTQRAA